MAHFADGMKHRPRSTSGTVNADVLQHYYPAFVRDDCVDIILNSSWANGVHHDNTVCQSPAYRGVCSTLRDHKSELRLNGLDGRLQAAVSLTRCAHTRGDREPLNPRFGVVPRR